MSNWTEKQVSDPVVKQWQHEPTGVILFIRQNQATYGVCIQATDDGSVERVSIGDPETGQFRTFDDKEAAIVWASSWKEENETLRALAPGPTGIIHTDE